MQVGRTIKTLERKGLTVERGENGFYRVRNAGRVLSFLANGGTDHLVCLHVQCENAESDPNSDYYPGSFYKTLKSALASIGVA